MYRPDEEYPQVLSIRVFGEVSCVGGVGVQAGREDRHTVMFQPGNLYKYYLKGMGHEIDFNQIDRKGQIET